MPLAALCTHTGLTDALNERLNLFLHTQADTIILQHVGEISSCPRQKLEHC